MTHICMSLTGRGTLTRVCYFGTYDREDSRNKVIMDGLRRNNVDVIECHSSLLPIKHEWIVLFNYANLVRKFLVLKIKSKFDVVIVGFSMIGSFIDIFLAKLMTRKIVIFNPLVSLCGTLVSDRGMVKNFLVKKFLYFVEKSAYILSNIILTDTNQNTHYICKNFGINRNKLKRVFVGANTSVFYPRKGKNNNKFRVLYFGAFVPLHGTDYIIRAASLLKKEDDIRFIVVGPRGQTYNHVKSLSLELGTNNVLFKGWVKDLPAQISEADVCLGIFGSGEKSLNVIPKKAFETISMRKPLITGRSPAIDEMFTDGKNVILCEMANPQSLASSILLLKKNQDLRENIASEGYKLFVEHFTPEKIGEEILKNCLGVKNEI